ncbi:MAG TPA: hypothetical protein PK113_05380, partial [Bacillota bacterium]|nr:hypothetical protein [Bacillota bacterium]
MEGDIIKIKVGKDVYYFDSYVRLEDLSKNYEGVFYAALVNNRLRELTYRVSYDAEVEFLDYSFYDSTRIYATSMRYLVCMAFRRIYPDIQLKFSNSIAMGFMHVASRTRSLKKWSKTSNWRWKGSLKRIIR